MYAAVETNAYLSALKDSKNKLTDSQIGFFKERIDKDFWFWRYIAGETVDDENYVAVIDSSIMNNELVVIPAYVNIPEEDKRCCWITAQEAILEELGTLATTGLSSEVVDADTKHDKAYYEDVVTGAYTLYMAYMQHANVVMTSL